MNIGTIKFSILLLLSICLPIEAVLNYHDELFNGTEADRFDWSKHPCSRDCKDFELPKICKYVFVVEQLSTMSKACYDCPYNVTDCNRPHCMAAEGTQKMVYVVNRQLPGPHIEVCHNDTVVVEIRNLMMSESTTIHWHGIVQKETPFMDGVPMVSQCPILPGQKFEYSFYAEDHGTFFWHSHIGSQRADGLFGSLTINLPPNRNIHYNLYDYDVHNMVIIDWMQTGGDAEFIKTFHYGNAAGPQTILVNGKGRFQKYEREDGTDVYTPLEVFKVAQGKKYRFRLVDAGAENCPIEVSIDNHTLQIISLDGSDVHPVTVDVISIWPGERVDFVVNANKKSDNYWIRYKGLGLCQTNSTTGVYQVAILRYKNAPIRDPTRPFGYKYPVHTNKTRVFNPYNTGTELESRISVSVSSLNSTDANDISLKPVADQQVYLTFDFYPLDNYDYHRKNIYGYNQVPADKQIGALQLNYISMKMPSFPILTQWQMIKPSMFCNESTLSAKYCMKEQCACTHVIELKLNSVVELIFVDQGASFTINHPFHLHGHFFRVVATENLDGVVTIDRVKQLDKEGKIKRNLNRAPMKDSMKAPGGGYSIVRVHADNPGYWFFHCHFEQHTNNGMALIFKVGEHKDFRKVPDNFPKCGNYVS